jgi:hypothetical protein
MPSPRPRLHQPRGLNLADVGPKAVTSILAPSPSTSPASRRQPRLWRPSPRSRPRWPSSQPRPQQPQPRPQDSDDNGIIEESYITSWQEVTTGSKAASHPRQELTGNLQSWLQLWFYYSLCHLASVLQLNRSSTDAYVAYNVCSTIITMPFWGQI